MRRLLPLALVLFACGSNAETPSESPPASPNAAPTPTPTPDPTPAPDPTPTPVATPTPTPPAVPAQCVAETQAPERQAPHAHVRSALGQAVSDLVASCGEYEHAVDPTALGVAFGACFAGLQGPMGGFMTCDDDSCCPIGVSSFRGDPGTDGEGSWVVFRLPRDIGDAMDHVFWVSPDGARAEKITSWSPGMSGCFAQEGDLTHFDGPDGMTPRQWVEIGVEVRRFLCDPPMPPWTGTALPGETAPTP